MSSTANLGEFQQGSTATVHPTEPFLWSARRELWEFRSIYLAPLGVVVLVLVSFLISMAHMTRQMSEAAALGPAQQQEFIQRPYDYAAMFLMAITFLVAIFYCLEALHTERRDRSILFWKSLPVSDLTVVLSKMSVPVVVLPVIAVVLTIVTHLVMLLLNVAVLLGNRQALDLLWANLPLARMWTMMTYHMLVLHGLWSAPFYGWLLLASAWARRMALLWAAIPLVVIGVVEKFVFNSTRFAAWFVYRFGGAPGSDAFPGNSDATHVWMHLHPGQVIFNPGLWTGLAFATICIFLIARVRRSRGPV